MFPRSFLLALTVAAVVVPESPAHASWPHAPAINLPVCAAADIQLNYCAVPDGSGGVLVAWQDARSGDYDIYVQHLTVTGGVDPAWPANGRAICSASGNQTWPAIVPDGTGGAIVTWADARAGGGDVYAQHVLASGLVDPAWPVNGRAVCAVPFLQNFPTAAPDGAGGAVIAWLDYRLNGFESEVFVQHVLASGTIDPTWPVDGLEICTAPGHQLAPRAVSDAAGGAILTWADLRNGSTSDIYANRVRANGTLDPFWPVNGRALCTATGAQEFPEIVADGAGGAVVVWSDYRAFGEADVYAQHVVATGSVDLLWPVDGRAICVVGGYQWQIAAVSDGAGGAIVTWQDTRAGLSDIYAHHVLGTGVLDAAWPAEGRAVCTAAGEQLFPAVATDGAGGAIVGWSDNRNGSANRDVYAHRVLATGALDPLWPADGRAVSTATGVQDEVVIVGDDAGAAVLAWADYRSGDPNVYAQRVARYGVLGAPEPAIASVRDVANDQGGKVKLSWDASWLDTDPSAVVDHYWIFRSVAAAAAEARLRGGARLAASPSVLRPESGDLLALPGTTNTIYWEFVANQPAYHILSGYSAQVATAGDSTGDFNPPMACMVVAWNAAGTQYWASPPAYGYSVDNLPPAAPQLLSGNYAAGSTHLHWLPNTEGDLAGYRLYRGSNPGFVPSPANRVASPPDTGHADPGPAGAYYKLSAVDQHGNESPFALLTPAGTLAVAGGPALELAFPGPRPNPSSAEVTLSFTLPGRDRVRLALVDAAGRRVRTLLDGPQPAGAASVVWDGRDEAGQRVAAGIYFAKLETGGRAAVRRLVRMP